MSETIEVESIRRLDIQPGETLVVTLPYYQATEQEIAEVERILARNLPEGVHTIVTVRDVELAVVAAVRP